MDEYQSIEMPEIKFSSNSFANIEKITNVNNTNIYRTNIDNCVRYISVNNSTIYIGMKHENVFYIFNLIEDGMFPDDFKNQLETGMDNAKNTTITNKLKRFPIHKIRINNLTWIRGSECSKVINLDASKVHVVHLNEKLNRTCPNFRISIDYIFGLPEHSTVTTYSGIQQYKPDSLLLCLFNRNNCVSSLTIHRDRVNSISIDSMTHPIYEGRKFNKLLRAVLIIIAKSLDENIQFITSDAVNPISASLMINSFNAIPKNINDERREISNFKDIEDEIKKYDLLFSEVELTDANIQNAERVFDKTVDEINCTIGGNRRSTKKRLKNKKKKINNKKKKRMTKRR